MQNHPIKTCQTFPCALALAVLLLGLSGVSFGTPSYVVDQFDSDTTGAYVNQQWGSAIPVITWDDTSNVLSTDGTNQPGSGSAKWQIAWPTLNDQIEVTRAFNAGAILNLSNYTSVSFDLRFATNSATDGAGSHGALEVDAIPQSDGWPSTALAIFTLATASGTNWLHVSLPISVAGNPKLNAVTGIGLKMQQMRTGANLSGTTVFWIDNIVFNAWPTPGELGPPQIVQLNPAQTWQRLEFVVSNVPSASNPFDPDSIRLDGTFTLPSGKTLVIPAFWYQGYTRTLSGNTEQDTLNGLPQWRLRITPPEAGNCSLSLVIQTNGQPCATIVTNFMVVSNTTPARFGYVGIAPGNQYFQTGDGQALPLIGEDVAWPSSKQTYDYDSYFNSMQGAGENFARIWMCPWSFGVEDATNTLNNYSLQPAWQLDHVLQQAEQKGIYLQLTLVYHGMFESQPDYWGGGNYWSQNPYNAANGGPCVNQNAFFTNLTAVVTYQKRLRYLIGRYGYSQNLLAWEFFNEIDNEYAYLNANAVAKWHAVMGNWLHANDPNRHLITTSLTYARSHPEIWSLPQMDYSSEHAYTMSASPLSIASDAQYFLSTFAKPIMIGEFGTDWHGWNYNNSDPFMRGYREGLWSGALGGSVGSSMSWWWDSIPNYTAYAAMTKILAPTGWGNGVWTNIVFQNRLQINAIGLRSALQSLVYVVAADANFPTGATNVSLPLQSGQMLTLTNWPVGQYGVQWFDPATGSSLGTSQAASHNHDLALALPEFSVDVAGVIYATPILKATNLNANGDFQFQLNSGAGGVYVIEKSADLLLWSSFLTVTNRDGVALVTDSARSNSAAFYRARQQN